jgi:hypothetical protein
MGGREVRFPFLLRVLTAVVVAAGGLAVGASPAAAAGTITVTPSTGLVDGQVVNVTGSGWEPPHTIGYCQGLPIIPASQDNCATVPGLTTPDAQGNFSVSLAVSRVIIVQGIQVDCAAPSSPCVIGAADVADVAGTYATQPLDFEADEPVIFPGSGQVLEGDSGTATLAVSVALSFAPAEPVTVEWATDTSFVCSPFVAEPGTDYTAASGTVTFAPGDTNETVPISVLGDGLPEADECINVTFTNPSNATLGTNVRAEGVIRDDDIVKPDLVIKRRSDGVLLYDNVYTGGPTPYHHTIAPGGFWTFAILIQNDGDTAGDILLYDEPSVPSPFAVQYFYGYFDVTSAVQGSGLLFPSVAPGESRLFAVRFHAGPGTPVGAIAEVFMQARTSPINIPGANDAFRLRVIAGT